ncbi:MAG: glycoside hydrolase family 52 protein [Phycisphaerae bacterium]
MGFPVNFNAHHSPAGAYLTFTCGHFGTRGGLAAQLGKPANQDLFIGYKDASVHSPAPLRVLPFFNNADKIDPTAAFLPQKENEDRQTFSPFAESELTREYGWSTDRWTTNDGTMEFSLYTPFIDLPDPATATLDQLKSALLPAITAELIIDNRPGTATKTGFFSINFQDAGNRLLETLSPGRIGLAHRANYAFAAELYDMPEKGCPAHPKISSPTPFPFLRWWPHEGLEDRANPVHLLGTTPGIGFEVPPGKRYTLHLALACYFPEVVTTRLEGRYLYTRHYKNIEDVLNAALDRFCDLKQLAKSQDKQLANSGLSENQQFLIAHATRSYYANTQLLEIEDEPYWIVNEGEYCMMNTLDLAVDHVFWELDRNPWVVKNLLDNFLKRYSYTDQVKMNGTTENTETLGDRNSVPSVNSVVPKTAPGGISFTHDQGTHNQFSPFGQSSYELKNLTGCFSYMTQEQLCNWLLIAASYVAKTGDAEWAKRNADVFRDCYLSMRNRDSAAKRDGKGIMQHDTAMCGSGSEITTFDSLDASLGQARNNLYLAVKCWAAYKGLDLICEVSAPDPLGPLVNSATLFDHSDTCAATIASQMHSENFLAAIFGSTQPSRILPAIEALKYPLYWNESSIARGGSTLADYVSSLPVKFAGGSYAAETGTAKMISSLRTHTITLLSDPQHRNKFPDHGIKLSSTSNNSWLSKIAIVQHVARSLFNLDEDGNTRTPTPETRYPAATGWERADAAHVRWLTTGPAAYWCACDQIVNGEARGSKYYPRLITTALWLREVQKPGGATP